MCVSPNPTGSSAATRLQWADSGQPIGLPAPQRSLATGPPLRFSGPATSVLEHGCYRTRESRLRDFQPVVEVFSFFFPFFLWYAHLFSRYWIEITKLFLSDCLWWQQFLFTIDLSQIQMNDILQNAKYRYLISSYPNHSVSLNYTLFTKNNTSANIPLKSSRNSYGNAMGGRRIAGEWFLYCLWKITHFFIF